MQVDTDWDKVCHTDNPTKYKLSVVIEEVDDSGLICSVKNVPVKGEFETRSQAYEAVFGEGTFNFGGR
jgi:hypothetical protein